MQSHEKSNARVVFTIHGIRTRGVWQKKINPILAKNGFVHVPLDFGFFRAVQLLMPWYRRRQVDWFREEYAAHIAVGDPPPSIIAHSFGTYIVARTMEIYTGEGIQFDRIILCGSIVQRQYPWDQQLSQGHCSAVLNDAGKKDFWAAIAEFCIKDAGSSGSEGFTTKCEGLTQRIHPEFRHSDYFSTRNYEVNWVPFLNGSDPKDLKTIREGAPNNAYRRTILLALAAVFLIAAFGVWWLIIREVPPKTYDRTYPYFLEVLKLAQEDTARMNDLKGHIGDQVTWRGVVIRRVPGAKPIAFHIGLTEQSRSEEWFLARLSDNASASDVIIGRPVVVTGILEDINQLGAVVKECTIAPAE